MMTTVTAVTGRLQAVTNLESPESTGINALQRCGYKVTRLQRET